MCIIACTILNGGPVLDSTPSESPIVISTPSQTPEINSEPLTVEPDPTVIATLPPATSVPLKNPNVPLSETGPWLAYPKYDYELEEAFLVVINKDGSGRKIICLPDAPSYWGLHISPTNTYVAYSAFRDSYQYDAELRVVRLTNGEVEAEIPLYANGWYETWKPEIGVMTDEVVRAVGDISWSPGRRYLAFVGAKDGPSSDLYLYDISTRLIRRLTDGPNQVEITW